MYVGIGPEKDTVVTDDQAFDYALERCLHGTPDDQEAVSYTHLTLPTIYSV